MTVRQMSAFNVIANAIEFEFKFTLAFSQELNFEYELFVLIYNNFLRTGHKKQFSRQCLDERCFRSS